MADHKTKSVMEYAWISLAGTILAFVIAATVTYFSLYQAVNDSHRSSLANRKADQIADYFNQKQALLQLQLATFSSTRRIADLLKQDSIQLLRDAEEALTQSIPFAIHARLIPAGSAAVELDAVPPFTYASKDMVIRAAEGQAVFAEAMRSEGGWIITMVQRIVDAASEQVLGTLYVYMDTRAFSVELDVALDGEGEVTLLQSFDTTNLKPILILGVNKSVLSPPISRSLQSPNWRIQFTPSAKLMSAEVGSPLNFWLPLILALPITLVAFLAGLLLLKRHIEIDSELLMQSIRTTSIKTHPPTVSYMLTVFEKIDAVLEGLRPDASTVDQSSNAVTAALQQEDSDDPETEDEVPNLGMVVSREDHIEIEETEISESELEDLLEDAAEVEDLSSIFRAYDIRGIADEYLTPDNIIRIARAIGSEAEDRGEQTIIVGADGRISSPAIVEKLIEGLRDSGRDIIDIGTVPTPLLYFATRVLDSHSGVMVTASHNPAAYNGFKIVLQGQTLEQSAIQQLHARYQAGDFSSGEGKLEQLDITHDYMDRICDDIVIAQPLRIAIDCGNGVAGDIAPQLFTNLGCEVIPIHCEVDGNFPNHDPDPTVPENLQDLINTVQSQNADLGIAFDGDGDRLVVITGQGSIIWPDRLLMLFAKDIVSRNPGCDVVYDIKCTRHLNSIISSYGGRPIICRSGHSFMKAKLEETGALLAGEMSGHIYFKERWYGFDDGLYSAARLLEIVGSQTRNLEDLMAEFPVSYATPEIRVPIGEEEKFEFITQLAENADFGDGNITSLDGIRVDYADGWGLVRASNTSPDLTLRFEADGEEALARIKELFKQEILAIRSDLDLDF